MPHQGYEEALQRINLAENENSTKLYLSGLGLREIPPEVFKLKNLKLLDLSDNYIAFTPESIATLSNLQKLNLSNNQISVIPDVISHLTELQSLYLSSNQIEAVPRTIGNLTKLQSLNLNSNQITAIPDAVGNLAKLQSINLNYNRIIDIPDAIGNLIKLQSLNFSNNNLTGIPDSLGNLVNLQLLYLSENQITAISDSFGKLINLRELYLSDNQITAISDSFGKLINLRELYLSDNQITAISDSFGNLTNLQKLYLPNNQITVIPDSIGDLINLRELYLLNNQITAIPDSLGNLVNLKYLDLSPNQIAAIPDSFGNLINLRELYLGDNQITAIPDSLGSLVNLEVLVLSPNQITALPDSLGNLINLRVLYLADNQITVVPDSLARLTNLKSFFLHNNPGLGLPSELLGPTWQETAKADSSRANTADIIEYTRRINSNGRSLNEAKLILVGKGAVGKSSLVEKLKYDTFEPGKAKTEGISIERWELPIKGENIRLNVWDFGGQEIMHATHQFFLTERSIYLLVLNGREGTEDLEAEYWLKLIESFGGNSPVIIVLNKIKEHPFDLNRSSLLEKYPHIKAFIRTDCEDDKSIEELKHAIIEQTDALDELRVKFPGEWFSIKDELAMPGRNYLSFADYREQCAKHGVANPHHQEMLAKYLNQLGIVLNYRDDERLKDTHVLNPHWVTAGIYKILNSLLLAESKGEIRLDDIAGILPEPEYPSFMRGFILNLMKKFHLCFAFPNDDKHYLIPELLPKNQPEEVKKFVPEQCLNYQYHYRILPEGLLPRFITRTHFLSETEPEFRWRSGVILSFEGCRALVKADVAEKKVSISIMGNNEESRRRLLAVVRSDLEQIHGEIKNLNPSEMVPLPDAPEVLISYKNLEVMKKNDLKKFTQVIGEEVRVYNVDELFPIIDLPRYQEKERELEQKEEPGRKGIAVFISYAHEDESYKSRLETHLKILKRQNIIHTWSDREILAGERWGTEIDKNLESAQIILPLISADFMASDYCYDIEMKHALERHQNAEAKIIPVIVRKCIWEDDVLKDIKALPKDSKPVSSWRNKDEAWTDVAEGIKKAAINLRQADK